MNINIRVQSWRMPRNLVAVPNPAAVQTRRNSNASTQGVTENTKLKLSIGDITKHTDLLVTITNVWYVTKHFINQNI